MESLPVGVNALAGRALLDLLQGGGPNVQKVVGAGVGDDAVPDDSDVGVVGVIGIGPLGGHVDKDLLGVPCEERGEVCLERESDDSILFLLSAVVMRPSLDTANDM